MERFSQEDIRDDERDARLLLADLVDESYARLEALGRFLWPAGEIAVAEESWGRFLWPAGEIAVAEDARRNTSGSDDRSNGSNNNNDDDDTADQEQYYEQDEAGEVFGFGEDIATTGAHELSLLAIANFRMDPNSTVAAAGDEGATPLPSLTADALAVHNSNLGDEEFFDLTALMAITPAATQAAANGPAQPSVFAAALQALASSAMHANPSGIAANSAFGTTQMLETIEFSPEWLGDKECSICCVPFDASQVIKRTQCKHYFHEECLRQWLMTISNEQFPKRCPLCRADVETGLGVAEPETP